MTGTPKRKQNFKSHSNQSTSTACWSHDILQFQYILSHNSIQHRAGKTPTTLHIRGSLFTEELLQKHLKRNISSVTFQPDESHIKSVLGRVGTSSVKAVNDNTNVTVIYQVCPAAWYQMFHSFIINRMTTALI